MWFFWFRNLPGKIFDMDQSVPTFSDQIEYHIAQASQAKHGSLVDRGANGGLAGSDVRILS